MCTQFERGPAKRGYRIFFFPCKLFRITVNRRVTHALRVEQALMYTRERTWQAPAHTHTHILTQPCTMVYARFMRDRASDPGTRHACVRWPPSLKHPKIVLNQCVHCIYKLQIIYKININAALLGHVCFPSSGMPIYMLYVHCMRKYCPEPKPPISAPKIPLRHCHCCAARVCYSAQLPFCSHIQSSCSYCVQASMCLPGKHKCLTCASQN